jgi:hypothetical protein
MKRTTFRAFTLVHLAAEILYKKTGFLDSSEQWIREKIRKNNVYILAR